MPPAEGCWRAAIIGCGQIAGGYDSGPNSQGINTHAQAYKTEPGVRLIAVADTDKDRAERFANTWKVPAWYTSGGEMLKAERPEIVSICTPDSTHQELLMTCLSSPSVRAIWCEKPLGLNLHQAASGVAACEEKKVVLAVNYQRRWDPAFQRIGAAIRGGEFGRIQKVVGFYTKGIRHNGSHLVDLLISWFGRPVREEVFGWLTDFSPDDPTVDARLDFDSVVAYLIGLDERAFSLFEIDVIGSRLRINIEDFGYRIRWSNLVQDPRFPDHAMLQAASIEETELFQCMPRTLQDILDALRFGREVQSNGRTALLTLEICDRLASLARKGESCRN